MISGNCSRQSKNIVIAQQQAQGHTGRVRENASVYFPRQHLFRTQFPYCRHHATNSTFQLTLVVCPFCFSHTQRQLIMSAFSNLESLHLDHNLIVDVPPSLRLVPHVLQILVLCIRLMQMEAGLMQMEAVVRCPQSPRAHMCT